MDPKELAGKLREVDREHAVFCDSSYFDDQREPAVVEALLDCGGSLHLTDGVREELEGWLSKRKQHPLALALRDGNPAIVKVATPEAGAAGRTVFDYYTAVLNLRRRVGLASLWSLSKENGRPTSQQNRAELFARVQRDYGDRGRMLATKEAGPRRTDEALVFLAVAHALRTGVATTILANDADVEEQLFKLLWMLNTHYRSMYCAAMYMQDPGSRPMSAAPKILIKHPYSPIEPERAVLIGGWERHLDDVLPGKPHFVPIACINGPATATTLMTFGGESEMAAVLDVKDETGGLSTDLLGGRNVHACFPGRSGRAATAGETTVLVAHDRRVGVPESEAKIPVIDVLASINNAERPRQVRMVPLSPPSRIVRPGRSTREGSRRGR